MAIFTWVLSVLYVHGKSTFIKNFMDLLVIPNIDNEYKKERARDELPQSAGGRTIMTTEPKFIPNEAVEIKAGERILQGIFKKYLTIDDDNYYDTVVR